LAGSAAASEAIDPIIQKLKRWSPPFPPSLVEAYSSTTTLLQQAQSECQERRQPLMWMTVKVDPIKQLMPKMEMGRKKEKTSEQQVSVRGAGGGLLEVVVVVA